MRIEIVVVGNELLNGDLADTNTARLATLLRAQGLYVHRGQTVPDEEAALIEAFEAAASRSDLVLVSGGLGPTDDDITVATAARWAGLEMKTDEGILARLKERFARRGYPFTENNARQARVPVGAEPLANPVGTAPGVRLEHRGATFFFFPGVPHELQRLADDHLVPWLAEHAPTRPYTSHLLRTFGKTESQVATLLEPLPSDPRVHIAYRAHFPEIRVGVHVQEADPSAAGEVLERFTSQVRELLGPIVFSEDPEIGFAEAVGRQLGERGETIATAESCTGGLVGKMLTDVPGSSGWFLEGAITYSNAAKELRLGISERVLAEHGAVSEPVARAMAESVRRRADATYGIGITGIAGPGGGTPDKPVGTVHFAVATATRTWHRRRVLPFDRARNRIVSAWMALDMVRTFGGAG